jgi:hypothetical protein
MGPVLASCLDWILFAIALGLAIMGSYSLATAPYDERERRPHCIIAICCYFLAVLLTGVGAGICVAIWRLNGG